MASNEQLRDVEELEQQFRSDPSPEVFLPLGEAYLRRGFPLKAIEVCKKGLKRGDVVEGHLLLAKAYFDASAIKRAYLKNASEEVESVLSRAPDTWEAHRLSGEIAIEQDDIQNAIKALKRSHELNPQHPQARMLLQSLGVEVTDPPQSGDKFYINVETGFVPPQDDSLLKALRDVTLFLLVVLSGVYLFATNSINEKKVRGLVLLGRSQQALDTYTGLKKAAKIYETVLKKFDPENPFALIHLSEVHYSLYHRHERTPDNLKKFKEFYERLDSKGDKTLLPQLASFEALKLLIAYQKGQELKQKGELGPAREAFTRAKDYLKSRLKDLPIHARLNLMNGLLHEAIEKPRHARAHLKRAAELGWNSPMFRWRLAHHYLITRSFAAAHSQYQSTLTQGKQSVNLINSFLTAPDKQKNEYCWIDPPTIFGTGAGIPEGLNLGTTDLLIESLAAAIRAEKLSKCPYHPFFQKKYKASPHYLRAKIGDVLSVLDSGVGMSAGYELADELRKDMKAVKKVGNLSPVLEAWANYALAKAEYYKEDYKKANDLLKKATGTLADEAFFLSLKGLLQIEGKEYDGAVKSFTAAFKKAPYKLQTYIEGITAFLNVKGDDGKATQNANTEKLLDAMKKLYGSHSDYLFLLGRLEVNKGNGKAAEKLWLKALDETKAPYYGDHYDANIAMGKLFMKRAKAFDKERKYSKKDYPELLEAFKKYDKKIRANIKRDTVAKELKKAYKFFDEFLQKIKDDKRVGKKQLQLYTGSIREAIYEVAGAHFQSAMTSRPGAVDARVQTGLIYFNSKSWNDCTGHFTVAAVGYIRDLNYKGAAKAYSLLAAALANGVDEKPRKKRKEKAEKVLKRFKFLATAQLRKAYLKVSTQTDKKKKKKLKPKSKDQLIKTLSTIADVLEKTKLPKPLKPYVEELRGDIAIVKDKGILAWFKAYRTRAQNKGKKKRRRRRRR